MKKGDLFFSFFGLSVAWVLFIGFQDTLGIEQGRGAIVVTSEEKEKISNLSLSGFFFLHKVLDRRDRSHFDCCRIQTMDLIYYSIVLLPENNICLYVIIEANKVTVIKRSNSKTKTHEPLNGVLVLSCNLGLVTFLTNCFLAAHK